MKIKCEYCGNFIEDTDDVCPHCGAPNSGVQRSGDGVPKTIEELQNFCAAKGLPLAKMHFFLGQNYTEPRAFGIYRDEEGMFVVYKNKSDGSRAIRYRGTDEAYAVNEIYQKLRSEVTNQRSRSSARGGTAKKSRKGIWKTVLLIYLAWLILSGVFGFISGRRNSHNGYYSYNGSYYYYQNDAWYAYDEDDYWVPAVVDQELEDNYGDYYESSAYSAAYGVEDFSDSSYYVEPSYSSNWDDDDDDWDWGGSDWDSGGTDWDSDW